MKILGLCGGTGSGKSTVASCFRELGVAVLDADAIYRELTTNPTECLFAIRDAFGDDVILQGRSLNRKRLGFLVFSSENAIANRKLLNDITHRFVKEEIERRIGTLQERGTEYVLLDVPLMFESGIDKICDFLICVTADRSVRVGRLLKRDGITREMALARIESQLSDSFLIEHTDFCIENNGTSSALLYTAVKELFDKIKMINNK